MGPNDATNAVLFMDEVELGAIEDIQLPDFETTTTPYRLLGADVSLSHNYSCTFTATVQYTSINRKRFVRYLQKLGYSKKLSKRIAWYLHKRAVPYSMAMLMINWPEIKEYKTANIA